MHENIEILAEVGWNWSPLIYLQNISINLGEDKRRKREGGGWRSI